MIWLGLALFIVGAVLVFIVFVFNSQTPLQLGPIPFFASVFVALIGLIMTVSHL